MDAQATPAPRSGSMFDLAAQSVLRRLGDGGGAALIAALDHVLRQNDWARGKLAPFAGSLVRIGVDLRPLPGLPPPQLLVRIVEGGLLERLPAAMQPGQPGEAHEQASVRMLLKPSTDAAFSMLREGPRGLSRHLRIDGDAMLAAALGEVAAHLRWDVEEDASRLLGDALANRLGRGAAALRESTGELRRRAESAAAGVLAGENALLVPRGRFDTMRGALDVLEARLAALELRQRSRAPRGV
ncbi:MAG: hypothetical protein J0H09_02275 [Burkholderiales bacterium]|nr:hypothetical protein [Burkholderiales bacterium]